MGVGRGGGDRLRRPDIEKDKGPPPLRESGPLLVHLARDEPLFKEAYEIPPQEVGVKGQLIPRRVIE